MKKATTGQRPTAKRDPHTYGGVLSGARVLQDRLARADASIDDGVDQQKSAFIDRIAAKYRRDGGEE